MQLVIFEIDFRITLFLNNTRMNIFSNLINNPYYKNKQAEIASDCDMYCIKNHIF